MASRLSQVGHVSLRAGSCCDGGVDDGDVTEVDTMDDAASVASSIPPGAQVRRAVEPVALPVFPG